MPKFKIYAGLGGGFGGSTFRGVEDFDTEYDAEAYAIQLAIEEYQSFEGYHGLDDLEDIKQEWIEEGDEPNEIDEDELWAEYEERMSSWLDYEIVKVPDDYEMTEDELEDLGLL